MNQGHYNRNRSDRGNWKRPSKPRIPELPEDDLFETFMVYKGFPCARISGNNRIITIDEQKHQLNSNQTMHSTVYTPSDDPSNSFSFNLVVSNGNTTLFSTENIIKVGYWAVCTFNPLGPLFGALTQDTTNTWGLAWDSADSLVSLLGQLQPQFINSPSEISMNAIYAAGFLVMAWCIKYNNIAFIRCSPSKFSSLLEAGCLNTVVPKTMHARVGGQGASVLLYSPTCTTPFSPLTINYTDIFPIKTYTSYTVPVFDMRCMSAMGAPECLEALSSSLSALASGIPLDNLGMDANENWMIQAGVGRWLDIDGRLEEYAGLLSFIIGGNMLNQWHAEWANNKELRGMWKERMEYHYLVVAMNDKGGYGVQVVGGLQGQ